MFLGKITVVAEGFSLSDFNRQFVINFSTHETKGLASIVGCSKNKCKMNIVGTYYFSNLRAESCNEDAMKYVGKHFYPFS